LDHRAGEVAADELLESSRIGFVEQGLEQGLEQDRAQGAGVAKLLGALGGLGDRGLMQLGEAEMGNTESVVPLPRQRHLP